MGQMRHALNLPDNPLDHSLEQVLPGVHQRLDQTRNEVTGLKKAIESIESSNAEVATLLTKVLQQNEERHMALAESLNLSSDSQEEECSITQ